MTARYHPRSRLSRIALRIGGLMAGVTAIAALGCQAPAAAPAQAANTALRRIEPDGSAPADADRAALSRFVGVWNFEGWRASPDGPRRPSSGRAAGAIEDRYFVLLDIQSTSGPDLGRAGHKSGSMLLASEPGVGMTLTAWGDASPAVRRIVGRTEGSGSVFVFDEASTRERQRISARITFETDDRWVVEIRDSAEAGRPVVASYTFTRVP